MPTNRKPISHKPFGSISNTALVVISEGLFGNPNADLNPVERLTYAYPTVQQRCGDCKKVWRLIRDALLPEWIAQRPGKRPNLWWEFEAPRMNAAEIVQHNWDRAYFAERLYEPRRSMGGKGLTMWGRYATLVPVFRCGIPLYWYSIDAENPPKFESQASYLRAHGLLTAGEEKLSDFAPETVRG